MKTYFSLGKQAPADAEISEWDDFTVSPYSTITETFWKLSAPFNSLFGEPPASPHVPPFFVTVLIRFKETFEQPPTAMPQSSSEISQPHLDFDLKIKA